MYIEDMNKLYDDYHKLIWYVINKKCIRNCLDSNPRIDSDDLFNEGFIGLMTANEKYKEDNEAGASFSTYAVWCIYSMVDKALKKMSTSFTIPRSARGKLSEMCDIENTVMRSDDAFNKNYTDDPDTLLDRIVIGENLEYDLETMNILDHLIFKDEFDEKIWTDYYINDKNCPMISDETGRTRQAIHARLRRINEYLRKKFDREDFYH